MIHAYFPQLIDWFFPFYVNYDNVLMGSNVSNLFAVVIPMIYKYINGDTRRLNFEDMQMYPDEKEGPAVHSHGNTRMCKISKERLKAKK